MLLSIYLIREEPSLPVCADRFLPSAKQNSLLPTPRQKSRKETERNYSSVIKLLETSPSRGLPLTGPTVESLNSKLLYFIRLDGLLPAPAALAGEKKKLFFQSPYDDLLT